MCRAGVTLDDAPRAVGWAAVRDLAAHLDEGSATWRAEHPELHEFCRPTSMAQMLAGIYDLCALIEYHMRCVFREKGSPEPERPSMWPTPWSRDDQGRIGSGAIPASEFEEWYYRGDV